MNTKFKECLYEVYLGEQAGEMIFESILPFVEDKEERLIYSNMLQLETEGKAIMRPLLVKLGMPIEQKNSDKNQVTEIVESFKGITFKEQCQNIHDSVKNLYLPMYEELVSLVDEDDEEAYFIAKFMGDHERAILQAAENILENRSDPIEPITRLLKFPI